MLSMLSNVQTLRSDNGGENSSKEFTNWLLEMGIKHKRSTLWYTPVHSGRAQEKYKYTPEQNGVAERENRTLVEAARSMLYGREQPLFLWGEAVAYAAYILNRIPSNQSKTASYEI